MGFEKTQAPFSITRLSTIDSTNRFVRQGLVSGKLTGTGLVVAARQTHGVGKNGRPWFSDNPHGFWATFYTTDSKGQSGFSLIQKISVAVAQSLRDNGLAVTLKWPNDVEFRKKKIAGILAETTSKGLLAGFGVNLRQQPGDFPEDLRLRATSLLAETGRILSNPKFENGFLKHFCSSRFSSQTYQELLGIRGQHMLLDSSPVCVVGVASDGALLTDPTPAGETRFFSGTLSWL